MKYCSFLALLLAFQFFAQEQPVSCAQLKSKKHLHPKSASLSVAEIAFTELYNVHYYQLDLDMSNTSTYLSGCGRIDAEALVNLDSALIELFETLSISQVKVNGIPVSYNRISNKVKIPVNAQAGQNFSIQVFYNGFPPTAQSNPLGGSGMTASTSPTWGNFVVYSLSEPFSAYEWFPVKQSLSDKADSCAVNVTVPDSCKAGSNGVLEHITPLGNGKTTYHWKHRHPIDYYLISVSVAKYIDYSIFANPVGAASPVLIQNYIYDNPQTLPYFQAAINETVDFIELYAQLYGPYPYADEKYGHCLAPLSGGMEHQTMTTQGFFEKTLTSHELAHQWWGDKVTCATWCDIWLNEGFAAYSEYLMLEHLYGGQQQAHMQQVHQSVMSQPGGSIWVLDSLNEARIFDGRLTYDKGAAFIHTLRYILANDSLFFTALQHFLTDFNDSTATALDFKNSFAANTGLNFDTAFEQWYYGEGFPTYNGSWNQVGTTLFVQLTQSSSMPSITPLFTNPIDLRFSRQGLNDTIIRVVPNAITSSFALPMYGTIIGSPALDPQNWIVNGTGNLSYDPNLLALTEVSAPTEWRVYPNPSQESIALLNQESELTYRLYSANGLLIQSGSIEKNGQLTLSSLAKGTYILMLHNPTGKTGIRLVTID
ncbi:MAG: hypothetical protein RLZZ301_1388 [Bacteroidota bacterium]|jgi:aminopeptidase N